MGHAYLFAVRLPNINLTVTILLFDDKNMLHFVLKEAFPGNAELFKGRWK